MQSSHGCVIRGHIDGPWVPRLDESSIYTVVIYLNDDYTGGCTNFRSQGTTSPSLFFPLWLASRHPLDNMALLYSNAVAGSMELLWKVTPRAGQALIFNHDTFHEGEAVLEGTKYILRTEVRVHMPHPRHTPPRTQVIL
jgi:hypothetical protein